MAKQAQLKGAKQATDLTTKNGNVTTNQEIAAPTQASTQTSSPTAQALAQEFANVTQAATDPTSQAQATTKEEVEAQDARTRLWQSLENSYNRQIEQSESDYRQAKENANRQALSRGMQRSSYALDTQANLDDKSAKATRDILSAQIADYQNRLGDLEQREQQQANWQAEFDANQAAQQWSQQFQQQQFDYQQKTDDQKVAYDMLLRMLETNDKPSDELLKRAGITRADYNQMKSAAKKSGGGSGGSRNTTNYKTTDNGGLNQNAGKLGNAFTSAYAAWLRDNAADKSVRDATTIKKQQQDLREKRGL
ncbi:MAG: hypothetical protein J6Y20_10270 [Lachnospiraceae bacterium]|nr:hypothetical protein [Lachnospiraceae bacterium]MBP5462499.1 hypothetical protein [Lachnospiraceae bacterium]